MHSDALPPKTRPPWEVTPLVSQAFALEMPIRQRGGGTSPELWSRANSPAVPSLPGGGAHTPGGVRALGVKVFFSGLFS